MMSQKNLTSLLKILTYIGIYGGLLMPLAFFPVVIFPFVFSKLLFFQFLIGLTFPAYLILAWRDPNVRPRPSLLYLSIAAYFVAIGVSTIFSVDTYRSWWGNQERMNGLFTLLHFFAWLTMTVGVLKTWKQWRRLLNYQVLLSVFMACVAMLQKPFPGILRFPAGDRVGGLLDNPIYMGAYQIFNFFFIALLIFKASTWQRRAWYAAALAADAVAFMLAQSRGALLGLAAGIVAFAVAYGVATPNKRAKKWVLGAVAACFLAYGALFAMRNLPVIQSSPLARFTNFSGSSRTRFIAWEIAWKGFLDRPLTGWGMDTFHILFNAKYNPESLRYSYYETWFDRSHNTILDVLSMTGILGLATFASIFISLYILVIRAYRRQWIDASTMGVLFGLPVGYFVQNLFVFDHPAAFSMSFLLYALVIAATTPTFFKDDVVVSAASSTTPDRHLWPAFIVLEALAIILIWRSSWLPMRASIMSINSNEAFGRGDYQQAYDYAKQAEAISTPYLDEQTFLQSRNLISLAADQSKLKSLSFWRDWYDLTTRVTDKSLVVHGNDTHARFIYARMAHSFAPFVPGAPAVAEREYKAAIETSPKRQQLFFNYARLLIEEHRNDEATNLLKQVSSFDDQIGEAYWLLGLHQFYNVGDKTEGAKNLVKARKVSSAYVLQDPREAVALAQAYDILGDKEGLLSLIDVLKTLPKADDLALYIQIAEIMERNNLPVQRNMIVGALRALDETWALRLEPLADGSVTSIASSLAMTANVKPPSKIVATTSTSGTEGGHGPRK